MGVKRQIRPLGEHIMTSRITIFVALTLFAGSASADFFDFFDMGDFFGNHRNDQNQQATGAGQTAQNSSGKGNGHSRGRGEADINMDFDLNFRAKASGLADAANKGQARAKNHVQSQGDVAQYQSNQLSTYGTGYNNATNANSVVNAAPYIQQPYMQSYYPQYYYPQAYYPQPAQ
jgi:hypothetical protein